MEKGTVVTWGYGMFGLILEGGKMLVAEQVPTAGNEYFAKIIDVHPNAEKAHYGFELVSIPIQVQSIFDTAIKMMGKVSPFPAKKETYRANASVPRRE